MGTETRDGISIHNDRLGHVASRAAIELDSMRLNRAKGDWHVRGLAAWLLSLSRITDAHEFPTIMFLHRLSKARGEPRNQRHEFASWAGELGTALFQSIHFDPTLNGWARIDLIHLCVDISKAACADSHFGHRSSPGNWRGVNWWKPEGWKSDVVVQVSV